MIKNVNARANSKAGKNTIIQEKADEVYKKAQIQKITEQGDEQRADKSEAWQRASFTLLSRAEEVGEMVKGRVDSKKGGATISRNGEEGSDGGNRKQGKGQGESRKG